MAINKDGPSQLYCPGCHKLLPARELVLVKKQDRMLCEDCRK